MSAAPKQPAPATLELQHLGTGSEHNAMFLGRQPDWTMCKHSHVGSLGSSACPMAWKLRTSGSRNSG